MGKKKMMRKTCSQSQKISRNHDKLKKQQLNSLINFMKPKVYITHSSNFKRLVQELTGKETRREALSPPAIPQPFEAPCIQEPFNGLDDFAHYKDLRVLAPGNGFGSP